MDRIAAAARVSKPTLYKQFVSKEGLFEAIVADATERILASLDTLDRAHGEDASTILNNVGRTYARVLLSSDMLDFHRLALSEAKRFPELGRLYYNAGPRAVESGVQDYLRSMTAAGLLRVEDASTAAQQFWALILAPPRQLLFFGIRTLDESELDRFVAQGVDVFLARYGIPPSAEH